MLPSRIFTSSVRWQPCWAQVVSAGWKRWAERAWQVRQATSFRAEESDSKWMRWPAVDAIRCQVFLAAPCLWHCSQVSLGTLAWGGTLSGRSMIQ